MTFCGRSGRPRGFTGIDYSTSRERSGLASSDYHSASTSHTISNCAMEPPTSLNMRCLLGAAIKFC
jgi:hypothetical protein